jgi:hypothetical protein
MKYEPEGICFQAHVEYPALPDVKCRFCGEKYPTEDRM